MKYNTEKMKQATVMFLEAIGENLNNPNIVGTPERVAKMWEILLGGYDIDTENIITTFPAKSEDMVTLSNIPIYSFCSHHLLPFIGEISIAYIPNARIVGISKLARIARAHSKKLQVQEDLTKDIADDLEKLLKAQGVAVQIRAQHFCTILRGARAHGSVMTTTHVSGIFKEDEKARLEFLDTIRRENSVFNY